MNSLRSIGSYLPSLSIARPKVMLNRVTKIALPAILFVGFTYAQKADASFGLFAMCLGICATATCGGLAAACVPACVSALAVPLP